MSEVYGVIYKAINKVNGKAYIGQTTKSLSKRVDKHINDALLKKYNIYFHNAIRKYGKENFVWEIVAECNSLRELNKTEIEMIERYDTFENGYNLTKGGEGQLGFKPSNETKRKMSEAQVGEKHHNYGKHPTEETKKRMSESHMGEKNPNYGKHFTEEIRKKISNSKKGKKCSKETKRKMSVNKRGEKNPNYGKRGKENYNYGKHPTEETRKRMRESHIGEKNCNYGKYGKESRLARKYIITTPNGKKIFVHGLRDFCKNYKEEKLYYTDLIKAANGKYKHHKGYKCKRLYEELIICQN